MHGNIEVKSVIRRLGIVLTMVLILAATANAYTIVMRGGRTIEVPAKFELTATTLTYEVSPGVQFSVAVAAIDVAATEKANGEQPGSFLARIESGMTTQTVLPARSARTITNRDLESIARRRLESEEAYEARRKQLGLPSVAETQRKRAAELDRLSSELAQKRLAENQTEQYWRDRATALRTEMAALDAEIGYVRAKLEEDYPESQNGWSSTSITNYGYGSPYGDFGRYPYGGYGRRGRFGGRSQQDVYVSPNQNTRRNGRRGRRNNGGYYGGYYGGYPGLPPFGGVGVLNTGVPVFDHSYERNELITRFNELGAERAGLNARWRVLEEEARRAGAQPGWLRP